ncbi:hypothetical protein RGQ29_026639 [Quercus rubra]|uniref:Uncharacterized protein n=1 Tax=Quercus rubra TaxID=3512 RepID=A0AAN7EM12_QUERU|nr:hypothetical protein RGQ29_026639 [Quercus rubra]
MRWSWFMPYHHFFIKRREERERAFYFYENGSLLLAKLIASCNAKPTPIRTFSAQQLRQATNNFSFEKLVMEFSIWYKGSLEGRIVLIKCSFVCNAKPIPIRTFSPQQIRQATNNYPAEHLEIYWYKGSLEGRIVLIKRLGFWTDIAINDLVISAQMSGHSNVLKPIGCCLHTPIPILVFEFAANGVLADRIYVSRVIKQQHQPMVWERSFYFSVSIPEDEADVEGYDGFRHFGFFAPEFEATGKVTEKADVYDFGRILLELLTGEDSVNITRFTIDKDSSLVAYIHNRAQGSCINEIVDPAILAENGDGGASLQHQLQAVLDLALTCTEKIHKEGQLWLMSPNNLDGLRGSHKSVKCFWVICRI